MFQNPYSNQNYIQELQNMRERIDRQLQQASQPHQQAPNINQTFQIAPTPSQGSIRYANSIDDVNREHPYGKFAVTMDGHITAIIDGIIYDTFDPSDRVMRCAWKIRV